MRDPARRRIARRETGQNQAAVTLRTRGGREEGVLRLTDQKGTRRVRKINASASVSADGIESPASTVASPLGGCDPRFNSSECDTFVPAAARRIANTNCVTLITGETGVGKGWLARWLHDHSPRSGRVFVPVNCGAIPDTLIDSHLFGHGKGSFSGAEKDYTGLVRAAQGGTLLLDEIADLPLTAQTRLLRLLEEREVQPVGYARPVKVDVRIIAATSSDLQTRVQRGDFREDLLFRLDVLRMHLQPLRERRAEIAPLLARFNAEFAGLYRQHPLRFSTSAMRVLEQHAWPGNVREVRTLIERLHVLCGTLDEAPMPRPLTAEDLASHGQLPTHRLLHVGPAAIRMQELKIETVNSALSACRGNMSRAATSLGVHRSTLYRWLANEARAAR